MSKPITRTQLEALVSKKEFDDIVHGVMQAGNRGQYVTVREPGNMYALSPGDVWAEAESGKPCWHYVPVAEWLRT